MTAETADNPFVGLRPFESEEDFLFFGREEQTLSLLQRLHQHHFVAVIGSSGSGKSSLIKAGLIPGLEAGYLVNNRDRWMITSMKPGQDPLYNLAEALIDGYKNNKLNERITGDRKFSSSSPDRQNAELQAPALTKKIREDGADAIFDFLQPLWENQTNFFLLVDQFEELFRFSMDQKEVEKRDDAMYFVNILLELAAQSNFPVYIVITMRSDFIGDCTRFYGLPEALNQSQYLVPRLNRTQLKMTIEGPVKLFKGKISSALTTRLLNDAQLVKDELPLLQHALMRTWDYERNINKNGELDIDDYEKIGGIEKALSIHADEALTLMPEAEVLLTKKIFQALTTIDDNGRKIRRPVRLHDLEAITGVGREQLLAIINRFIEGNRSFLVINKSGDGKELLIDISHESLIRQWTRLSEWVDEEAQSGTTFLRLTESAKLYGENKKDLLAGNELQQVLHWYYSFHPSPEWSRQYNPDYEKNVLYLKQSEQAAKRKKDKNRMALGGIIFGLAAVVFILAFSYNKAEASRKLAVAKSEEARQALAGLKIQKNRADSVARIAVEERNNANINATESDLNAKLAFLEKKKADSSAAQALMAQRKAEVQYDAFRLNALAQEWEDKDPTIALRLEEAALQKNSNSIISSAANKLYTRNAFYKTLYADSFKISAIRSNPDNTKILSISQSESTEAAPNLYFPTYNFKAVALNRDGSQSTSFKYTGLFAAFSGNGNRLLTGSYKSADLWDIDGKKIASQRNGPGSVAAVSSDGKKFSIAIDDSAFLWNSDGKSKMQFAINDYITYADFSPDNKKFLAGSDSIFTIWNIDDKDSVVFKTHYKISKVIFSPDGTKLLAYAAPNDLGVSSASDKVELWNINTKKHWFLTHPGRINSAIFSPDGSMILTGSTDHTVRLWNTRDTSYIAELRGHTAPVSSLAFSPNNTWILTGADDGTAKLWSIKGSLISTFIGHTQKIIYLAFSPDGARCYTGSEDNSVKVWNTPLSQFAGHTAAINLVAFSKDGTKILTGSPDETARLWDLGGNTIKVYKHNTEVSTVAFSPKNSSQFLTASGNAAYLWNSNDAKPVMLSGHTDLVQSVAFSSDGTKFLTSSDDRTVRQWYLSDLSKPGEIVARHESGITSVAYSRDGKRILTGSRDGTAKLWRTKDPNDKKGFFAETVFAHKGTVYCAAFSPDETKIITGSDDSTAVVWSILGKKITTIKHYNAVESVAFSPDGTQILTGSHDNTARLCSLDGKLLRSFDIPDQVRSVAFSPDGKSIFIASKDGIGRLYRITSFEDFLKSKEADRLTKQQKDLFKLK